jgi:hypothetical protein
MGKVNKKYDLSGQKWIMDMFNFWLAYNKFLLYTKYLSNPQMKTIFFLYGCPLFSIKE